MPYFEAKKAGGSVAFNYKIWLQSAGISATGYANLAAVLADEVALRKLMTIHAAVDYLAGWDSADESVVTILSNDFAAKWITLRDYAEDTLTAAYGTLMASIGKYGYGEWVKDSNNVWGPKGNVPIMSSDTAPYGEAFASVCNYQSHKYSPFNGDKTITGHNAGNRWTTNNNEDVNAYIGYKFTNPVCIKQFNYIQAETQNASYMRDASVSLEWSNDGTNYTPLQTFTFEALKSDTEVSQKVTNSNNIYALYWRLTFAAGNFKSGNDALAMMLYIQFYGRELKVSVPKMTSNDAPYGHITFNHQNNTQDWYLAFDGNSTTRGGAYPTIDTPLNWVQYQFTIPACVTKLTMLTYKDSNCYDTFPIKLQASNVSDFSALVYESEEKTVTNSADKTWVTFDFSNTNHALYYRLVFPNGTGKFNSRTFATVYEIQFYGKNYSEYDWDQDNPRHYLYDHGVELENLVAAITGSGTVEKYPDYVKMTCISSDSNSCEFSSNSKIDLSSYNLLRSCNGMESIYASDYGVWDAVASAKDSNGLVVNNIVAYRGMMKDDAPYNHYLDISSVSGQNYTALGRKGTNAKETITEWWLE